MTTKRKTQIEVGKDGVDIVQPPRAGENTPAQRTRPSHNRSLWAQVVDTSNAEPPIFMSFASKQLVKKYLMDNPTHVLAQDFMIWGYKKPIKRVQSIQF